jgi:hypothetical protein
MHILSSETNYILSHIENAAAFFHSLHQRISNIVEGKPTRHPKRVCFLYAIIYIFCRYPSKLIKYPVSVFFSSPCPRLYPCPVSVSMSMSIIGVHMLVSVSVLLYVLMYMHVHVHLVRLRECVRVHVNLQKHIPHTGNRGWICVGDRTCFIVSRTILYICGPAGDDIKPRFL